jgi:hypothetical protein
MMHLYRIGAISDTVSWLGLEVDFEAAVVAGLKTQPFLEYLMAERT